MPGATGLDGTDMDPDYFPEGLFEPDVPHKVTVIKRGRELYGVISNPAQDYPFYMVNRDRPPVAEGRVGLRHMFTRSACYKNIRISVWEG